MLTAMAATTIRDKRTGRKIGRQRYPKLRGIRISETADTWLDEQERQTGIHTAERIRQMIAAAMHEEIGKQLELTE